MFDFTRLPKKWLLIAFVINVAGGFLYVTIQQCHFGYGDIFAYQREARLIYDLLLERPLDYLQLVFGLNGVRPIPENISSIVLDQMHYWDNKEPYFLVRLNALFFVFSFGSYACNILFYNFLVFFGLLLLYRIFLGTIEKDKPWLFWVVILLPSAWYWFSGVHKDGLAMLGMAFIFYAMFQIQNRRLKWMAVAGALIGFFLLFIVRDYYLLALFRHWSLLLYVVYGNQRCF